MEGSAGLISHTSRQIRLYEIIFPFPFKSSRVIFIHLGVLAMRTERDKLRWLGNTSHSWPVEIWP